LATFANNRSIYPNTHSPKPIENPEPFGVPHRFRLLPEVASGGRVFSSREDVKARRDVEKVAEIVVAAAFQLHRNLGPGLLESVYEAVLASMR
jgi:hypothetical protein